MSVTSSTPQPTEPMSSDEAFLAGTLIRSATSYFERFEDRYDCQELLGWQQSNWLLSTDEFKHPTDPPVGLINQLSPGNSNSCILLIPAEEHESLPLDYREFHHVLQELVYGIYVLNQTPTVSLEANFDLSTTCQLPPAYIDTRIGQILVNVDYMMKCLWHGAYFPKEKRAKFNERWRRNLDVDANGKADTKNPLLAEFQGAGKCNGALWYHCFMYFPCIADIKIKATGLNLYIRKNMPLSLKPSSTKPAPQSIIRFLPNMSLSLKQSSISFEEPSAHKM